MNLNAHLLRLWQIADKIERGEEPTEEEVAYVRWLCSKIYPLARAMAQAVADAMGTTIEGAATRLEAARAERRRRVIAERDAAREMMVRRWRGC